MKILPFQMYAVDPNNPDRKALIGTCFNKGLAKSWAEETITIDDIEIISEITKEKWYYIKKEKRWK